MSAEQKIVNIRDLKQENMSAGTVISSIPKLIDLDNAAMIIGTILVWDHLSKSYITKTPPKEPFDFAFPTLSQRVRNAAHELRFIGPINNLLITILSEEPPLKNALAAINFLTRGEMQSAGIGVIGDIDLLVKMKITKTQAYAIDRPLIIFETKVIENNKVKKAIDESIKHSSQIAFDAMYRSLQDIYDGGLPGQR